MTGILGKRHREAIAAARWAGAVVHRGPSAETTVIVRGRPNPLQAAGGDGGLTLMDIKRLREKGQRVTALTDAQVWRGLETRPHSIVGPMFRRQGRHDSCI